MSEHTPGPWEFQRSAPDTSFRIYQSRAASELTSIAWVEPGFEGTANARLIAAAPEMLKALRKAGDAFKDECIDADAHLAVLRAIDRAEGNEE